MSNFFNKTPYTDFHELNLDWLLERVNNIKDHVKGMQDDIIYLQEHTPDMDDYYDKTEIDALLADKADVSDLPDMTDYYDKTETDALLANKADVSDMPDMTDYYDKTETDALLADKANVSDIPTVNNGTLTIQRNSTTVETFTANSVTNKTVNIQCEPPITWTPVSQNGWNSYTDSAGYVHMYRHSENYTFNFNTQEGAVYLTTLDSWALTKDPSKLIYAEANAICPNKLIGVQFNSFTSTNFTTYYYGFTPGSATFSIFLHLVYRP